MQKIADLKEDVKQKKVSFLAYLKGAYNLGFLGLLEVITFQNFAASPIPSPCGTLPLKKTKSPFPTLLEFGESTELGVFIQSTIFNLKSTLILYVH